MCNDDRLDTICAMRMQEENGYRTDDYLYQQHFDENNNVVGPLSDGFSEVIDAECRLALVEWCFKITDFCRFQRETAAIAVSYLDRYMSTKAGRDKGRFQRNLFQLVAMTALYTAVKIHEPQAVEPMVIARLSRGAYTVEDIEAMELSIIHSLGWKMNPPTATAFLAEFLNLIVGDTIGPEAKDAVFDVARYLTELAVGESQFMTKSACSIAAAALLNAMDCSFGDDFTNYYAKELVRLFTHHELYEISEIQRYLYEMVSQNECFVNNGSSLLASSMIASSSSKQDHQDLRNSKYEHSPRCVLTFP